MGKNCFGYDGQQNYTYFDQCMNILKELLSQQIMPAISAFVIVKVKD